MPVTDPPKTLPVLLNSLCLHREIAEVVSWGLTGTEVFR